MAFVLRRSFRCFNGCKLGCSLFAFLHEEVFSDSRMFKRFITTPIESSKAEGEAEQKEICFH